MILGHNAPRKGHDLFPEHIISASKTENSRNMIVPLEPAHFRRSTVSSRKCLCQQISRRRKMYRVKLGDAQENRDRGAI